MDEKKFLDRVGLEQYDNKIKTYIDSKAGNVDAEVKDNVLIIRGDYDGGDLPPYQPFTEEDPTVPNYVKNITEADISNWNNKQTALDESQLIAINSGITIDKVSTYDGYTSIINSKYTKPSTGIPASDLAEGVIPTSLPASDIKSWAKADSKPTYTASEVGALANTTTHLSGDIATSQKGVANGVATLDANGLVPSSQLPSYVDDVLEYSAKTSFPTTGETGKIYVDTSENLTYRWSGTAYVEISPSIALGETSSTAYAGDKGKANAEAIENLQENKADKLIVTTSADGLMSSSDKTKLDGIATGATAVNESTVSGWGFTKNTGTFSLPSGWTFDSDKIKGTYTTISKTSGITMSVGAYSAGYYWDFISLSNSNSGNSINITANGIEKGNKTVNWPSSTADTTFATQEDINNLKTSLNDLKINEVTVRSTGGGFSDVVPYPEGFNKDNCYVVSIKIILSAGDYRSGDGTTGNTDRVFARLSSDGIAVYNSTSTVFNVKVALLKIS